MQRARRLCAAVELDTKDAAAVTLATRHVGRHAPCTVVFVSPVPHRKLWFESWGADVCAPFGDVEEACLEQSLLSVANGKHLVDPAYGPTMINLTSAIRGIECVS